jgi:hypothetical protein
MIAINATRREWIEVEISERDLLKTLDDKVRKAYGIEPGHQLREGKIYYEVRTSHSYDECAGPATERQLAGFALIAQLIDLLLPPAQG